MGELINTDAIQLFEDKKIRTAWDEEQEEWYFSIVDVISVLTGTENPRRYWSDLKRKLKKEGAVELYEKMILSRLVDTFISRISLTMLPVPNPHNTACVLSWEEARHWQSRSSDYSSS